jgi:hypothetical protein
MMSHHNIVDVDSEFANRWVCTETDDNREIKLHPSLDFPDWCPLKVISDDPIKPAQRKDNDPDFHTLNNDLGGLISLVNGLSDDIEADAINENRTIRRRLETLEREIWKIRDTIRPFDRFDDIYNNWQESHDAAIRNAVLDELGVLHGEDAKRFTEQLDHPEPLTPEARDLVMQAKEIAKRERTALDDRDRLIREDEREKVLAGLNQGRKIITLCGSVKFWDEYVRQNAILTLQGNIVFSCGLSLKAGYEDLICDLPLDGVKADLDFIHLRKIDLSDEIFVLNVGGYIGDSTKREIEYALSKGKVVRYLESPISTTPAQEPSHGP